MSNDTIEILMLGIFILLILGGSVASNVARKIVDNRQHQQQLRDQQGEPICGCGHHHAFHDPQTGSCAREIRHENEWHVVDGTAIGYVYVPCECQQYSGQPPLASFDIYREWPTTTGKR